MIRIGIIGAGPNATGHGKYFAKDPRTKVVAVADPDEARAKALAAECGAKHLADFAKFLSDVDAVVVSSPNFLHKEQAIAVAKAGKHVYCEKPVGLSGADAKEMAAACATAKITSQVGFSVRFDASVHEMLRALRAGEVGDLVSTASRRLCWSDAATGGWRADPAKSGGLLFEINIHEIEWMMAAGDVRSVYARTRTVKPDPNPRANDHLWVLMNYASGAVGTHEGSWKSPNVQFWRNLQGTTAGFNTNEWGNELYRCKNGQQNRDLVKDLKPFDLHANFLDAIEGKAKSTAPIEWGAQVMVVCDAIIESARTGQVVAIAPSAARAGA